MQTKRERSVTAIAGLSEELRDLDYYVSEEEQHLAKPVDIHHVQTYWSQSKLDQLEKQMRKALIKAKALRYDLIAPVYDQMCFDLSQVGEKVEGGAEDLTVEEDSLPF